ncbi:hypothetical protein DFH01_13320 [Falsiroseomonas bella]|uniref:Uncharacterized protein n=1 Tax=Falsiroseomonas bella TaxID=2184016 RepID=A0A317FF04_9PROT|nr:hypothetical protein [Falsiroseomonas bella]PWS36178.1 hypothetical protein DFH01_13320 [Falsiroseomonas bella]
MIQVRMLLTAAVLVAAMPRPGGAQSYSPGLDPGCARERDGVLAEAGTPGMLRILAFEALEVCVAEHAIAEAGARSQSAAPATARALAACAAERQAFWAEETTPGILKRLTGEALDRCLDRRMMEQARVSAR